MVDVTTSEGIASRLSANGTVLESRAIAGENKRSRRERIRDLREAVQRGEYSVSASDVADAILRAARRAN